MHYFGGRRAPPVKIKPRAEDKGLGGGNLLKLKLSLAFGLALTPLSVPLLAHSHPLIALLIRSFFSGLCHQDPARSFLVEGSPVAVCVRCLGIYWGAALALLLGMGNAAARRLLAVAVLLNLLDVATAILHWHGNLAVPRFFLGLLLGLGAGAVVLSPLNRSRVDVSVQEDGSR
jgi:uncharacterized membrane protein